MRVVYQIGFKKSSFNRKKEGQHISVLVNDVEMGFENGKYLTSKVDTVKRGVCWYLGSCDVFNNDVIKIKVKTVLAGIGVDEERTLESCFVVSDEFDVQEVKYDRIGDVNYPLLKGRVEEIFSFSEDDNRKADIDSFLDGDF